MTALWKRISYIDWPLQLGCKLSLLQDEIVELKKTLYLCLNLGATALQTNVQSRKWDDFDVFSYHNNSCVTSSPSNQNVMKYFCHKRRPLLAWKSWINRSLWIYQSQKSRLPFSKLWQLADILSFNSSAVNTLFINTGLDCSNSWNPINYSLSLFCVLLVD